MPVASEMTQAFAKTPEDQSVSDHTNNGAISKPSAPPDNRDNTAPLRVNDISDYYRLHYRGLFVFLHLPIFFFNRKPICLCNWLITRDVHRGRFFRFLRYVERGLSAGVENVGVLCVRYK